MSSIDTSKEYALFFGIHDHLVAIIPNDSSEEYISEVKSKIAKEYNDAKQAEIDGSKIMTEIFKIQAASEALTMEEERAELLEKEEREADLKKQELKYNLKNLIEKYNTDNAKKIQDRDNLLKSRALVRSMRDYRLHLETYNEINRFYPRIEEWIGKLNKSKYDETYWNRLFNRNTPDWVQNRKDDVEHFERMLKLVRKPLEEFLNSSLKVTGLQHSEVGKTGGGKAE
jgi:hypothetical protein